MLLDYVRLAYGSERADLLQRHADLGGSDAWLRRAAELPLTELLVKSALGAVVHSSWQPMPTQVSGRGASRSTRPARSASSYVRDPKKWRRIIAWRSRAVPTSSWR